MTTKIFACFVLFCGCIGLLIIDIRIQQTTQNEIRAVLFDVVKTRQARSEALNTSAEIIKEHGTEGTFFADVTNSPVNPHLTLGNGQNYYIKREGEQGSLKDWYTVTFEFKCTNQTHFINGEHVTH